MLLPFEHHACQSTRHIGPGIDIDAIREDLGPAGWGVAVNDPFPEIHLAIEKLVTDPKEILVILAIEGYARPNTRVAQEERSGTRRGSQ